MHDDLNCLLHGDKLNDKFADREPNVTSSMLDAARNQFKAHRISGSTQVGHSASASISTRKTGVQALRGLMASDDRYQILVSVMSRRSQTNIVEREYAGEILVSGFDLAAVVPVVKFGDTRT